MGDKCECGWPVVDKYQVTVWEVNPDGSRGKEGYMLVSRKTRDQLMALIAKKEKEIT